MTASGEVTTVQHTYRVSSSGEHDASTGFLVMFRIDGHQYSMTATRPLALADGDRVEVAGRNTEMGFVVFALRNLTNGISTHSGMRSNIATCIILPIIGLFFGSMAASILKSPAYGLVLCLAFLSLTFFACRRVCVVKSALRELNSLHP
jgi:hypothetical protein